MKRNGSRILGTVSTIFCDIEQAHIPRRARPRVVRKAHAGEPTYVPPDQLGDDDLSAEAIERIIQAHQAQLRARRRQQA